MLWVSALVDPGTLSMRPSRSLSLLSQISTSATFVVPPWVVVSHEKQEPKGPALCARQKFSDAGAGGADSEMVAEPEPLRATGAAVLQLSAKLGAQAHGIGCTVAVGVPAVYVVLTGTVVTVLSHLPVPLLVNVSVSVYLLLADNSGSEPTGTPLITRSELSGGLVPSMCAVSRLES